MCLASAAADFYESSSAKGKTAKASGQGSIFLHLIHTIGRKSLTPCRCLSSALTFQSHSLRGSKTSVNDLLKLKTKIYWQV